MRRLILVALLCLLGSACGPKPEVTRWEYKVVNALAEGHDRTGEAAGNFASITLLPDDLNALGAEGWEMVDTFLEMETAWVNFGNKEYVAGLQPNVRPQRVVMIFKRQVQAPQE